MLTALRLHSYHYKGLTLSVFISILEFIIAEFLCYQCSCAEIVIHVPLVSILTVAITAKCCRYHNKYSSSAMLTVAFTGVIVNIPLVIVNIPLVPIDNSVYNQILQLSL